MAVCELYDNQPLINMMSLNSFLPQARFTAIAAITMLCFYSCDKQQSTPTPPVTQPKTLSQVMADGKIWHTVEVDVTLTDGSTVKYTDTTGFDSLLIPAIKFTATSSDGNSGTVEIQDYQFGGVYQNISGEGLVTINFNQSKQAYVLVIKDPTNTELTMEATNEVDDNGTPLPYLQYSPGKGQQVVNCSQITQIMGQ